MNPDSDLPVTGRDTATEVASGVDGDTAAEAANGVDGDTAAEAATGSARAKRTRRRKLIALVVLGALLVSFAAVAGWYATTRKPLTALPGLSSQPRYLFSIYGVTHPMGVAVTPSGDRIYITQSDGERVVRVYDRSGEPIGSLRPPASTGTWHIPVYVAVNPTNGEVYVSDRATAAVYVYDASGGYLRDFTPKGDLDGGWAPLGLAFDAEGRLYATDVRSPGRHRVLIFGPDGSVQRSLGVAGQLSFPNGVVVDRRGNVAVSDSNNGQLVFFDPSGQVVSRVARGVGEGDLGLPRGAAVDDGGRLYVVDTVNHVVRMYRVGDARQPVPRYIGSFGEEGTLDGLFEFPNGIATDSRARIYITDRENNRVQVWTY